MSKGSWLVCVWYWVRLYRSKQENRTGPNLYKHSLVKILSFYACQSWLVPTVWDHNKMSPVQSKSYMLAEGVLCFTDKHLDQPPGNIELQAWLCFKSDRLRNRDNEMETWMVGLGKDWRYWRHVDFYLGKWDHQWDSEKAKGTGGWSRRINSNCPSSKPTNGQIGFCLRRSQHLGFTWASGWVSVRAQTGCLNWENWSEPFLSPLVLVSGFWCGPTQAADVGTGQLQSVGWGGVWTRQTDVGVLTLDTRWLLLYNM